VGEVRVRTDGAKGTRHIIWLETCVESHDLTPQRGLEWWTAPANPMRDGLAMAKLHHCQGSRFKT